MFGTELSYVLGQLDQLTHTQCREVSKKTSVPFRTVKRMKYRETGAPRSDNVGKLAIYFRTREKRRKSA